MGGCGGRHPSTAVALVRSKVVESTGTDQGSAVPASPGEALYQERCSTCHGSEGQGLTRVYPAIWGAGSTTFAVPLPGSYGSARHLANLQRFLLDRMPPRGSRLTAIQAAALAQYLANEEQRANPGLQIGGNSCG